MTFVPKDWRDYPDVSTPVTAVALEDMETRLAAYADTVPSTVPGPIGPIGVPGPPGVGAAWKGVWSAATTYALGDGVFRNGISYISNIASNLNHDPATDTTGTNWAALNPAQIGVDVWASQVNPATITDWGIPISSIISGGVHHLNFSEHLFPCLTPIIANGQAQHIVFQGVQGRGWYTGAAIEHIGTRLLWKGGASPQVTGTNGAITTGTAVFTSASAPFTVPAGQGNICFNGRPITINGAGPGGTNLVTRIINRISNTQVTLADNAGTTVSAANWTMTDWSRFIQVQGSSGISFRDMKITYDSNVFDGILIDGRSDSTTWSARLELSNCLIGTESADYTNATTVAASAVRAFALVHLCGMGEHFHAEEVSFGGALSAVRGMYDNNADDAHFKGCHFNNCIEAAVVNPGRFWKFDKCSSQGSAFGGPRMGPIFKADKPYSIESIIELDSWSGWDFSGDFNSTSGASITTATTTLTISGLGSLTTFTEDMFWKDRLVTVRGAGVAGADLKTRVVKRLSTTTVQLRDAASTTVSNVGWSLGDGGFIYTAPGSNWDITLRNQMTWLCPSPEIEMLGGGSLTIQKWWNNRPLRLDIPSNAEVVRFGNPATDSVRIDLQDIPNGSPNLHVADDVAIANYAGHDVIQMRNVSFAPTILKSIGRGHRYYLGLHPIDGAQPTVVAHAGVTLNGGVDVWGNDERGVITFNSTGSGIAAGLVLDMTFKDTWPSPFGGPANVMQIPFKVNITAYEHGPADGSGASTVKAGIYAKADNSVNTGLNFGIANAIVGAQTIAFCYDIERL